MSVEHIVLFGAGLAELGLELRELILNFEEGPVGTVDCLLRQHFDAFRRARQVVQVQLLGADGLGVVCSLLGAIVDNVCGEVLAVWVKYRQYLRCIKD